MDATDGTAGSGAGRVRRRLVAALAGLALAACSSGQDPGVDQAPQRERGSTTAPALLEACPPGGPDASTPPAGCVDDEGNVVH